MTESEMFEKSFERPTNYFKLTTREQWAIDERLGVLDWIGDDLSEEDRERYKAHYEEAESNECEECRDYKETLERIVANDTAADEIHCGCCVMLRAEVERLRSFDRTQTIKRTSAKNDIFKLQLEKDIK